jgi:chromosome partitioning protein
MRRLSIISHKGGAGKTSSAVMLAEDLAGRGLRVVLVDADRQRGAGLLLGIEQPTGSVQQTKNPRLRYFCSSSLPLRELPERAEDLVGLFDVAVVDTPSLDDPLAKAWIQLSTDALMVLPVEPLSIRTLEGADTLLDGVRKLNPSIRIVGTLPTLFDQKDPNQRSLLVELMSLRPEGLLSVPIPEDLGIAHRAQQRLEHRTEPSEATRAAYAACGDFLIRALDLGGLAQRPAAGQADRARTAMETAMSGTDAPDTSAVATAHAKRTAAANTGRGAFRNASEAGTGNAGSVAMMRWAAILVAALAILVLSIGLLLRPARSGRAEVAGKRASGGILLPTNHSAVQTRSSRVADFVEQS